MCNVMLSVILLSLILLSLILQGVVLMNTVLLSVILLSPILWYVVLMDVVLQSVIVLNVAASLKHMKANFISSNSGGRFSKLFTKNLRSQLRQVAFTIKILLS